MTGNCCIFKMTAIQPNMLEILRGKSGGREIYLQNCFENLGIPHKSELYLSYNNE